MQLFAYCFPRTSRVHGVVIVHAAGLGECGEQAADGVQRVAHPTLQVSGGGHAPLQQLWTHQRDIYSEKD